MSPWTWKIFIKHHIKIYDKSTISNTGKKHDIIMRYHNRRISSRKKRNLNNCGAVWKKILFIILFSTYFLMLEEYPHVKSEIWTIVEPFWRKFFLQYCFYILSHTPRISLHKKRNLNNYWPVLKNILFTILFLHTYMEHVNN